MGEFDVLWIDDHSEDNSRAVIESLISETAHHRLICLQDQTGKKAALEAAISYSTAEYLVTIDADSSVQPQWLTLIAEAFAVGGADMLILPVSIDSGPNVPLFFQSAENCAIQGLAFGCAAWGVPISCNGANLAFRKSAFEAVGGYSSHQNVASGDDVLLMQAFANSRLRVKPIWHNGALVRTAPVNAWCEVWKQRVRWAGKSGRMTHPAPIVMGLILVFHSLILLIAPVFGVNLGFYGLAWLLKIMMDVLLIKTVAKRYNVQLNPLKLAILSICYAIYLPVVTFVSMFWRPMWKGRRT